jgi:nucleotide-binding universal stress UspA family protein
MSSVLVGFGTQDHSTAALRWGAQAAMLLEEPLKVVSVSDPAYGEFDPARIDDLMVKRRAAVAERVRTAGVDDSEIRMLQGDPIRAFADYVERHDEALVVVGASAQAGWGEFASRACAHALLHHLQTPLAVIRDDFEPLEGGTMVVGVDGSEANALALRWSERVALAAGARLLAVFVYDPIDDTFIHPQGWHRHSDEVRSEVEKIASVPIELIMEAGHPTEVLIDVSQRERAAAIVVGARGRGGFLGLHTGRVATQLIDHSVAPVVVLPDGRAGR